MDSKLKLRRKVPDKNDMQILEGRGQREREREREFEFEFEFIFILQRLQIRQDASFHLAVNTEL